jgi:hypothetical protein
MKGFINEALGGVTARVEAVETTVTALQSKVAAIRGQVEHLKGESSTGINTGVDIIPSLVAAERVAFSKILIIKGAILTDLNDLKQFAADMFGALGVGDIAVRSLNFMGKPVVGQGRLIRLEVEDASQAVQILKAKRKLSTRAGWERIYINQMRSSMLGKMESRMNSFYRTNAEHMKMKKFHDGILFVDSNVRVPVYKFAAAEICVGNQVIEVPTSNLKPNQQQNPQNSQDSSQTAALQQRTGRRTRNSMKSAVVSEGSSSHTESEGGKHKKKSRVTPYDKKKKSPMSDARAHTADSNNGLQEMEEVAAISQLIASGATCTPGGISVSHQANSN